MVVERLEPQPPSEPLQKLDIEQETFKLINAIRLEHGKHELDWDDHLASLAREHSEYMAQTGEFEHSDYKLLRKHILGLWLLRALNTWGSYIDLDGQSGA